MQAGDAHQVIYAGAGKHLPLIGGNGALIANRQRHHNAGIGPLAQRCEQTFAHRFARSFQQITGSRHHWVHQTRRWLGADISGCADAALEHPGFDIESTGIGIAVRPVQAHRHAPALARMQIGQCFLFAWIPHHGDARWNPRVQGVNPLYVEAKAHPACARLYHFRNDAGNLDVTTFPDFRQFVGDCP